MLRLADNYVFQGVQHFPKVALIVPFYNDAEILKIKIESVNSIDYPANLIEVYYIDNHSTDQSADIIRSCQNKYTTSIIKNPYDKSEANIVNFALQQIDAEVIVFTKTDCFIPMDDLKTIVSAFAEPSIGGVCSNIIPKSAKNGLSLRFERTYRELYERILKAESVEGSIGMCDSPLFAVRKSLAGSLQVTNPWSISTDMALSVKRLGYKFGFVDAGAIGTIPDSLMQYIKQKSKVQKGIRTAYKSNKDMVDSKLLKMNYQLHSVIPAFSIMATLSFIAYCIFNPYALFVLAAILVPRLNAIISLSAISSAAYFGSIFYK
ncbi:glycosyltransferase [Candidatus Woesearchaeota archaeon]|nr:glycosyltransferase [Candidatus Woesearchaeota archaeon]